MQMPVTDVETTRSHVFDVMFQTIPNSGPVSVASAMRNGLLIGIRDGAMYWRDTLYGTWVAFPVIATPLIDIIQLRDGTFLGVGRDNCLHTALWPTAPWFKVRDNNEPIIASVTQIDDGSFLGVGVNHTVYQRAMLDSAWEQIPNSGNVVSVIQTMDDRYLAINTSGRLCIGLQKGGMWQCWQVNVPLTSIAELPDGSLLGVTANQLAVSADIPYCWWVQENSDAGLLSAAQLPDGTFCGVRATDNLPCTAPSLDGPWTAMPNATQLIGISVLHHKKGLMGVTTNNLIATCPNVGGTWTTMTKSGSALAAIELFDETILGIGLDYNLYTSGGANQAWIKYAPANRTMISIAQQADGTLLGASGPNTGGILYQARFSHLLGKIEQVVMLMLENRSFDSCLGYLYSKTSPPANVIPPPAAGKPAFYGLDFATTDLTNHAKIHGSFWRQAPQPSVRATNSPGTDPFETYEHVNAQLFGVQNNPEAGRTPGMKGFLADFALRWSVNPTLAEIDQILQIMSIYTPADLPVLSTLAASYAVCDRWFSSVPTQTNANRAFSLAGTSLGEVNNGLYGAGWINEWVEVDSFKTETVFNVLHRGGFSSWAIFYYHDYPPGIGAPYTKTSFPMIEEYADPTFHPIAKFLEMAEKGTLPAFSYIEPAWGGAIFEFFAVNGTDYHPPADTIQGEAELRRLFEALFSNANWEKTLFIITFDEHGGTYDHVPPPWGALPPWGKGRPSYHLEKDFRFDRFGVRVPTILVSPLIAPNTVFRSPTGVPYDHTSLIATILDWQQIDKHTWNLGARVAAAPTFDNVVTLRTPRTGNPFAPATSPPTGPIRYGDPFVLINANGKAVIRAQPNPRYYFARLGTERGVALQFRLGFGPLTSGCKVQLFTSETLPNYYNLKAWDMSVFSLSTALGAWRDAPYCYYYPTRDEENYQQQVWQLNKINGNVGDPINYGDHVQLINMYFSGQGLIADSVNQGYVTTAAGQADTWTLQAPPS